MSGGLPEIRRTARSMADALRVDVLAGRDPRDLIRTAILTFEDIAREVDMIETAKEASAHD